MNLIQCLLVILMVNTTHFLSIIPRSPNLLKKLIENDQKQLDDIPVKKVRNQLNKNGYNTNLIRIMNKSIEVNNDIIKGRERNIHNKQEHFRLDQKTGRRLFRQESNSISTSSSLTSSSSEEQFWADEWKEIWAQKKYEALNDTNPEGDVINMVAARPWGVPCGDPNQHDVPWGSCTLPLECDPEFRIYRGDYFCGRTHYVCCAIQLTNYDMNQGIEQSMIDTSLSTSTEEKKLREMTSKERKRRRLRKQRKRRTRARRQRNNKMKRQIKKIMSQIKHLLNNAYRNATKKRVKKTKQFKKFIKYLKENYKKDRKGLLSIHTQKLLLITKDVLKQLGHIRQLNTNFLTNDTYREIIVNGTANPKSLRMMIETLPELLKNTRRGGSLPPPNEESQEEKQPLHYDLEYGALYF